MAATLPLPAAFAYQVLSLQSLHTPLTRGKYAHFHDIRVHFCNPRPSDGN